MKLFTLESKNARHSIRGVVLSEGRYSSFILLVGSSYELKLTYSLCSGLYLLQRCCLCIVEE